MVDIKTLLNETEKFLKAATLDYPEAVAISKGPTGLKNIADAGLNPPEVLIYVEPDKNDQESFDGYSSFAKALVTFYACASGATAQDAAIESTMLAYAVEKAIWKDEAFMQYLNTLEQEDKHPHNIGYDEKVTYDNFYSDFATSYFSIKVSIVK
jgi:hypothetical protein